MVDSKDLYSIYSKQFNTFLIVICQGLFLHHAPYIFFMPTFVCISLSKLYILHFQTLNCRYGYSAIHPIQNANLRKNKSSMYTDIRLLSLN